MDKKIAEALHSLIAEIEKLKKEHQNGGGCYECGFSLYCDALDDVQALIKKGENE